MEEHVPAVQYENWSVTLQHTVVLLSSIISSRCRACVNTNAVSPCEVPARSPMCVAALTGCTHEQTSCVLNPQPSLSVPAVYLSKCLVGSRAERGKAPFTICFLLLLYITTHLFFCCRVNLWQTICQTIPECESGRHHTSTRNGVSVCVCFWGLPLSLSNSRQSVNMAIFNLSLECAGAH